MENTMYRIWWPGALLETRITAEWSGPEGLRVLDPNWRHVDANGHAHIVADGDTPDGRLPTLRWVSEPCTMGHGDDCDAEGHYACRHCGETVKPGTKAAPPRWVPGPTVYRLTIEDGYGGETVYEFGIEQWDAVKAAAEAAVADVLSDRIVEQTMGSR